MCKNWPNFPINVIKATWGLIEDTVIICGGSDSNSNTVDDCYSLTSEKATRVTQMSVRRQSAASIVLNDKTMWITGGYDSITHDYLASTEYVTVTETISGPDLPTILAFHAMVAINTTCSMVIGGYGGYYSNHSISTFFYDHIEDKWINGPSMIQGRNNDSLAIIQKRNSHTAGIVTDEVTDEHFVVVTGGRVFSNFLYLDSTEILQDGEWVQGKIHILIFFSLAFLATFILHL